MLEMLHVIRTHYVIYLQECQQKLDHSLPLHSHLIKPVQRILKYPLLLEVCLFLNEGLSHNIYVWEIV